MQAGSYTEEISPKQFAQVYTADKTAKNLTKYKKGTIIGVERLNDFLTATLQIEEKNTIDYLVEMYNNLTPLEVSAGYFATTEKVEDRLFRQRNIKGNHLAILPVGLKGRAGSEVRLIYNKHGGVEMSTKYVTNAGDFTADELVEKFNSNVQAYAELEAKVNKLEVEKSVYETEKNVLETKLNTLESEAVALKLKVAELTAEKEITALRDRVAVFIENAEDFNQRELKEKVILKVNSKFDPTDKSEESINATFEFAMSTLEAQAEQNTTLDIRQNVDNLNSTLGSTKVLETDFNKYRTFNGGK